MGDRHRSDRHAGDGAGGTLVHPVALRRPGPALGLRARRERASTGSRLERRRALAHRPRAGAARVRAREDVDPCIHRRPRRLAALGRARPCGAPARPHRDSGGSLLRDGPRQALGPDRARSGRDRLRQGRACERSHRGGAGKLRPRRHRRVHRAGRHRRPSSARPRARYRDLLQLPARPHAAALREARRAPRRPDDDDSLPGRLRPPGRLLRAAGRDGARGRARGARRSPAARRRDREVRTRDVLLRRGTGGGVRRRDAPARPLTARRPELRQEAGDVRSRARRPVRRGDRRRLRVRGRQFREPRHGRAHGGDPGRRRGGGDGRRLPRARGGGRRPVGWSLPRDRRPWECREAPGGRRREPSHGAHDESRAPDPDCSGLFPAERGAFRPRPDDPRPARIREPQTNVRPKCGRQQPIRGLLSGPLSLPQPDFGVLRKAQRGDERAFSIIVRAYQVPVFNYVLRLVGDRSLAEDLTQEIFLRVFQGLPRFSLRSKFTTWLFQVAKNRVLDELRAVERRPRAVVDIDDLPPLEVLDAPFERLEAIDAVWRAVEALNVDLKMALLLRDIVRLAYTEIADSLEVTLATVKWRIYKAREDVQVALARQGIRFYADERAEVAPALSAPTLAS